MSRTRELDPVLAIRLRECGCSWAEIGRILAIACLRPMPFQALSVYRAVRAYDLKTKQAPQRDA